MIEINPDISVSRYPESKNKSLRAWSAADEYILKYLEQVEVNKPTIAIYNDRFGYLSCALSPSKPIAVTDYKSSEIALRQNLHQNGLDSGNVHPVSSLSPLPRPLDIGIINIPKSLDLFRFYLGRISEELSENGVVICGFMTRHFSKQMLTIGSEFFEEAEQTLAWKKSRLLILKKKKTGKKSDTVHSFSFTFTTGKTENIQQYPGVFSAGHIDYATQFLLEKTELRNNENRILDLASGNGVIARDLQLRKPDAEIHLLDDFILAIESSKLNTDQNKTSFHYNNSLKDLEKQSFDLVISNPPFHLEHENNMEVTLTLFKQVAAVLKNDGRFLCVANRHLNYKTHLSKIFTKTEVAAENNKYIVYQNEK